MLRASYLPCRILHKMRGLKQYLGCFLLETLRHSLDVNEENKNNLTSKQAYIGGLARSSQLDGSLHH